MAEDTNRKWRSRSSMNTLVNMNRSYWYRNMVLWTKLYLPNTRAEDLIPHEVTRVKH